MAVERVVDAGSEQQLERRRPGRLVSHAGDTGRLILYYSRLLRATDTVLHELAGSPPEVLNVVQEYRDQFESQIGYWSGVREQQRRSRKPRQVPEVLGRPN